MTVVRSLAIALALAACGHGAGMATTDGCTGSECCRGDADCTMPFERCYAPGADVGCGACMPPEHPCQHDADCANTACTRRRCTTDAPCQGACVDGQCYTMFGCCAPPPA